MVSDEVPPSVGKLAFDLAEYLYDFSQRAFRASGRDAHRLSHDEPRQGEEKRQGGLLGCGDAFLLCAEIEEEIAWCAKWLPQQASEAELRDAVAKVVAELPAKDPKMAGKVIGAIKKQFGDRADAQLTKKIAEELLSK